MPVDALVLLPPQFQVPNSATIGSVAPTLLICVNARTMALSSGQRSPHYRAAIYGTTLCMEGLYIHMYMDRIQ